jgi:DNA polymerase-3 subunit alpha
MLEHGHKLADDAVVTVRGRFDTRDDAAKVIAQEITVLDANELGATPPLRLKVPANVMDDRRLARLQEIITEFPGESPVYLHLDENQVVKLHDQFCVNLDKAVGELRVAFGADAVML